mmetsp:Transcript_66495/g.163928  ORF Transcript_66495/g.163928 Transcript_66495/m.163928 type:complete len:351 (-) Transcript_66495:33-1085(-)
MAKRKQGVDTWGLDREYTARGYKVEARPSLEEQLLAVQGRVELIKNGSDDALLEELERLSRSREDKLNALTSKDAAAAKGKGTNRTSAESLMKAVSDEFDQLRADAQKRLLKECLDEEERLKEEIASNKGAGIQMREKRKTRARLDAEATVPNSQSNILNKLMELEGKVVLIREDLDSDLDCLRLKEGKGTKFVQHQSAPIPLPRAIGKAPAARVAPAVERPPAGKAPVTSSRAKPPSRGKRDGSDPPAAAPARPPPTPEKKSNGRMPGEHKVYSAKGIMYCSGLRILKGEEVKVTMPDGEEVIGRLSSVNSLEMRLVIHGQESLYKVMLQHLRTGKATVVKTEVPAASA